MAYILERVVDGAYLVRDTEDGITEPIFDAQVKQLLESGVVIRGLDLDLSGNVIQVEKAKGANLAEARKNKNDEFYTQLEDIRVEFNNYNPSLFEDKVIYCPCDAPMDWAVTRQSQFVRFFTEMAHIYKYKKLIVTCLYDNAGEEYEDSGKVINKLIIERKTVERDSYRIANSKAPIGERYVDGRYCYVYQDGHTEPIPEDVMKEAVLGEDGKRAYMIENEPRYYTFSIIRGTCKADNKYDSGDFRSEECRGYMQECDIVVTNPPFSIFREFISQIVEYGKDFIVIGNANALTYMEFFPLIYSGRVHLGANMSTADILKPELDDYTSTDKELEFKYRGKKIPKKYRPDADYLFKGSNRLKMHYLRHDGSFIEVVSDWFTTLPVRNRQVHDKYYYRSMDALKAEGVEFPRYDNYNAIEVSKECNIPIDYDGVMGVPITSLIWLDTENLWEIVDANEVLLTDGHSPTGLLKQPNGELTDDTGTHTHFTHELQSDESLPRTTANGEAAYIDGKKNLCQDVHPPYLGAGSYVPYIAGVKTYARLFLRRRTG